MNRPSEPRTFRASRHHREVLIADWRDAEEFAAWHMSQVLGIDGAALTGSGSDGGLDVISPNAVAQVKHYGGAVGSPEVQQARGAGHGRESVLFYALSGFTPSAVTAAHRSNVALFQYNVYGDAIALNPQARHLIAHTTEDMEAAVGPAVIQATRVAAARAAVAPLLNLLEQDPQAGEMPIRRNEEAAIRAWPAAFLAELERPLGEGHVTLERYDYNEGGRRDLRWYEASGGPTRLPSLMDETNELAEDIMNFRWGASQPRTDTRADFVECAQVLIARLEPLVREWQELKGTLPADKLGYERWFDED